MAQTTQKTSVTCNTGSSLVRYQHWAWRERHRKHSLMHCCMAYTTQKTVSHVRLRVHWSVTSSGRGVDNIENTTSSIVTCWTVFTELLPGNELIKSVTIYIQCGRILYVDAVLKTSHNSKQILKYVRDNFLGFVLFQTLSIM
jgi:hypothetical protein